MGAAHSNAASGINSFGANLLDRLPVDPSADATLLSPWGVAHALSMLLEGTESGSKSHKQLSEVVFATKGNAASLSTDIKSLTEAIVRANNDKDLTVADANSAWVAPTTELQPSYVAALKNFFNADAAALTGADVVNAWVDRATHGKISSIIDESAARQAALILVNAIYFKALWEQPFNKRDTRAMPFHLMDGSTQESPHMWLKYTKGTSIQGAKLSAALPNGTGRVETMVARLKYKGGAYSAVIAAPSGNLTEAPVNGRLTLEGGVDYAEALHACRSTVLSSLSLPSTNEGIHWLSVGDPGAALIKLYLPRFEVETSASLAQPLRAAGLDAIFAPGDFTRIATGANNLMVSDVIHKVYVKADEEGTEAAAATAVMMVRSAMILNPPEELFMKFDRPFLFTIVHEETGLALFVGEINRPEKETAGG